ncbi:PREDICTED: uncharacterized protein LOC104587644 isoform X1 [Nelumbo nucifera]|uniref:F-box domain-containing protein n=2 Tax=Nelumbo nucifera TaxID=4432 RepID=A0A822XM48_NELNU|nr:PREDICTED: uncharacterized protein LOC104587644 isoform X1 [Nelumbo nucifera]DAD20139.1 TPA_asm: hypothetical protein HUJ06_021602 [Nelumbo nucifera]
MEGTVMKREMSVADYGGLNGGGRAMERNEKRGKRLREEQHEEVEREGSELLQDPLVVFGSDIMLMILSRLDARSLAVSLLVSRGWHSVASSNSIWSSKCKELWQGKAHIPRLSQVQGISKLAAYSFSVMDGKRNRIMKEDLCDHVWEFRFKKEAPEYWRNLDPSWKGTGPPMHRYFHPNGTQTADPGDPVWGGHECSYSVVTSFVGEGRIREHYVRINRWPQMSVSRKQDWSWELANHLFCYTSIPDPEKEGGTGPLLPVWYSKTDFSGHCSTRRKTGEGFVSKP